MELDEGEDALVKRYAFDKAVLIELPEPGLLRRASLLGVGLACVASFFLVNVFMLGTTLGFLLGIALGIGGGYLYFHNKRESLFVKDLLHGRDFICDTVVDLAHKEAWIERISGYLRQVMESAKHWDGTEKISIEPLPKEEAKAFILRGV